MPSRRAPPDRVPARPIASTSRSSSHRSVVRFCKRAMRIPKIGLHRITAHLAGATPGDAAMPHLTLVSHHLCPYVQRVAIALAERGIAAERVYIDLADKPAWFRALSPLGKVPLLKVDDAVLFESAVICEYLEDT